MTTMVQRVAVGVTIALIVAVAAGWTARSSLRATVEATDAVTSSATFLGAVDALYISVVQAENRVRGYALTGDAELHAGYLRAATRFEAELEALRARSEATTHVEALDLLAATFDRWESDQAATLVAARELSTGIVAGAAVRAYGAWLDVMAEHAAIANEPTTEGATRATWRARLDTLDEELRTVLAAPLGPSQRESWSSVALDVQAYRRTYEDAEGALPTLFAADERFAPFDGVRARLAAAWTEAEGVLDAVAVQYEAGVEGDLVMTMRSIVDAIRAAERLHLAELTEAAAARQANASLIAWLAPLLAVVVSSIVVVSFIAQLGRHVTRLGRATRDLATGAVVAPIGEHGPTALRPFTRDFDRMAERVRRRDLEAGLLAELAAMAHAARSIDEALPIARALLPKLLPGEAGALWLVNPLRDGLERATDWGDVTNVPRHVGVDGCWAVRQGKTHKAVGHDAVRCDHDTVHDGATLCVPLFSRDEALGVLTVRSADGPSQSDGHWEQLTRAVAEQVALALANLVLRDTLKEESIRDALTGLYNRRFLEHSLALEVARANRSSEALSMLMIDVDHFKRFNDSHGHDAGDAVLRAVGRELASRVRAGDIACRYGGEEFSLLLPGADEDVAVQRAETLRLGIESITVVHHGVTLPSITASVGVASVVGDVTTPETLVRRADRALYAAKEAGRNRVSVAGAESRVDRADVEE